MKIALLHYHLKPGGVTTVIRNARRALEGRYTVQVLADFDYDPSPARSRPAFLAESNVLAKRLAGRLRGVDVLHTHNIGLGKHPRLTYAVKLLAQQQQRQPRGSATATGGGKKGSVDYGRPALKGRKLDELLKQLPPERIWRAGENQVTTLTTEDSITVGGTKVPAGKYSVYVHAAEGNAWDLVLTKDPGVPLGQVLAT